MYNQQKEMLTSTSLIDTTFSIFGDSQYVTGLNYNTKAKLVYFASKMNI